MINLKLTASVVAMLVCSVTAYAQKNYEYITVPNDPFRARIYTLDNGLKVYISVNEKEPRVQSLIAVRAGSSNDPAHATGLAHYLEHMLFKGTDRIAALNPEAEQELIRKIETEFEQYRVTKDSLKRAAIYQRIDSLSSTAAKMAVTGEYDKLMADLGSTGTNAYTWVDQTVYMNEVPSNQLKKFLLIESERFRKPVFRLFHTELEAVYEEKNRSLDSDNSQVYETLFSKLYPGHPYGTQTTIGTIEHLKNPSMKEIRKFYDTWYVPNNMAICLSGDLNPDSVIVWVDQHFGAWKKKPLPPQPAQNVTLPAAREEVVIEGPEAERVVIGFRIPGAGSREAELARIVSKILYNGQAGIIDMELNQSQRLIDGYSAVEIMDDYSMHEIGGRPREGQSLEEVYHLLLEAVMKVSNGEYPDWLPGAVLTNIQVDRMRKMEDNAWRAHEFVSAFVHEIPWNRYVEKIRQVGEISREDIMHFMHEYYVGKEVVVFKKAGQRISPQVAKPPITPVEVIADTSSAYAREIRAIETTPISPVFPDFSTQISKAQVKPGIMVFAAQNRHNDLTEITYYWEMGTNHNTLLPLALEYLKVMGAEGRPGYEFQQEFYRRGLTFNTRVTEETTTITLSGPHNSIEHGLSLLHLLFEKAHGDSYVVPELVSNLLKDREDAKKSRGVILRQAMYNYALYGAESPFTNRADADALKKLQATDLAAIIKTLPTLKHTILYYGPERVEFPARLVSHLYSKSGQPVQDIPEGKKFGVRTLKSNEVVLLDYDMTQAELLAVIPSHRFDPGKVAYQRLLNAYFSYQAFQQLRESKALAYATFGRLGLPDHRDKPFVMTAYIGSQADKLNDATAGLFSLLHNLPLNERDFESERLAQLEALRTERITGSSLLWTFVNLQRLGLTHDYRRDMFEALQKAKPEDLSRYMEEMTGNRHHVLLVLGDDEKLDQKVLSAYGSVKKVSLKELFGY